ncbi:unnamed protein product [Urochloa humidicola]
MGSVAPYAVSLLLRLIYGVTNILIKGAFSQGTSACVLVFYRFLIASVLLLPVAFAFERKTAPPLSFKVSLKLFVHALYGMSASTMISYIGLDYDSATSASAVINLLPVFTFFLAALFRMESLNLKRSHGVVKVCGLVLCSIGVTVLALYQGPELKSFVHHRLFHHTSHDGTNSSKKWILGVILQSFAAAMWALWAVLQGITLALLCYLQFWLVDMRGPVFLSTSVPLTLVFTIILTFLIGEAVTLGSVISGVIMVGGLIMYCGGRDSNKLLLALKEMMAEMLLWIWRNKKLQLPFRKHKTRSTWYHTTRCGKRSTRQTDCVHP